MIAPPPRKSSVTARTASRPAEDEAAFIEQAESLAPDTARQRRLGNAAAARARHLSWDAIIDGFEHVLLRLAHPQPAVDTEPAWPTAVHTG